MTVEERAKKVIDKFFALPGHDMKGWAVRKMAFERFVGPLIVQALRDQIEDCAKAIEGKIQDWEHSMKTIKHFTGTYEEIELMQEMAETVRAMAGEKEGDDVQDKL